MLIKEQAAASDAKKREAILHRIQQLMHEKAGFGPLLEPAILIVLGALVGLMGTPTEQPEEVDVR